MRTFGQFLGRSVIFCAVLAAALWTWGPYEQISLAPNFDPAQIGPDPDAYLTAQEARFSDITPGVEKRILWHAAPGAPTDTVIVYVHGFSASSEEIRPVPDKVAEASGANLVFTRLQGHGRDGEALAQATVQGWANDLAEAMAIARQVGSEVILMGTSTGATLIASMLDQADINASVSAVILISPNFEINNPMAPLLTFPAARSWVPILGGRTRDWEPQNEAHKKYWTKSYPTEAVFQMAALVELAAAQDYSNVTIPALVWVSDADQIVVTDKTRDVFAGWGASVNVKTIDPQTGMDSNAHVIAGDALSPGLTQIAIDEFTLFIKELEK